MRGFSMIIFIGIFMMSCGSGKPKSTPEQIQRLQELVQSRNYNIVSTLAFPQVTQSMNDLGDSGLIQPGSNITQIDLTGNSNYLKIQGDSIFVELPYFGERLMNTSYSGKDNVMIVKNTYSHYKETTNDKDGSISISFRASTHTEPLRFNLKIYPSLKCTTMVSGSTRFLITYKGEVNAL